jgi:hypothetical protein
MIDPTIDDAANSAAAEALLRRYRMAMRGRENWLPLWQDTYEYALPLRNDFGLGFRPGDSRVDRLYDATALDSVEQLAASLMGNMTPPWTQWFGLTPGPDLSQSEAQTLAPALEQAGRTLQSHFDRSNFLVEIHQAYLDLVVGGTAAIYIDEADPGDFSAFRFSSIPLSQIVLEEGASGLLDGGYRLLDLNLLQLKDRYPFAPLPADVMRDGLRDAQLNFKVLESVLPDLNGVYNYAAILMRSSDGPLLLRQAQMAETSLIAFRWLKSPGETYGRSPVMKALPDIKTANKVVELILKNASIAVTGIWQADDDGVLNPANIELKPGSIIPKAVGSQGLQPLEMPGRFDISQLVLNDLRTQIRHALLSDKLAPVQSPRMTATEVLERSGDMAMVLGATYGRLQCELLTPLLKRAYSILRRRGEVPDIALDGRYVQLDYRGPLARGQAQDNVQNILSWVSSVMGMGPAASSVINLPQAARFLGQALGVPADLMQAPLSFSPQPQPETNHVPTIDPPAQPQPGAAALRPAAVETA